MSSSSGAAIRTWISWQDWPPWPRRPRVKPRVNLTRYHGVLVRGGHPHHSQHRSTVTPTRRSKKPCPLDDASKEERTPMERRAAMTWARRLKRVFNIDIETCLECGGKVKIIACIDDPSVAKKILAHLKGKQEGLSIDPARLTPPERAPPQLSLLP